MPRPTRQVPVAIAHDYLTQRGGAERVVLALSRVYPEAPIYTTLYDPEGTFPEFADRRIITSPLNLIAPLRRHHRAALPLLAPASSMLRIPAAVTVASSSGWAHGFRPTGALLVYCHNPARWLYQREEYLGDAGAGSPRRLALAAGAPLLRRWDRAAAARADRYVANSAVVRDRIARTYGIDAPVLPPPPGLDRTGEMAVHPRLADWEEGGFWLVVSRLLPYKNVDLAIEAFREGPDRLVVVGAGPERERLEQDLPETVRIVSHVSDAELRWAYAHAHGLVAPSLEDFGLTPLEANGWGLPVVALRGGGYLETVVDGVTGVFVDELDAASFRAGVDRAQQHRWDARVLQEHAIAFGEGRFAARVRAEVEGLAPEVRGSGQEGLRTTDVRRRQ